MKRQDKKGASPKKVYTVDEGVSPELWQRVSRISPILNAWKALVVLLGFVLYRNYDLVLDIVESDSVKKSSPLVITLTILGGVLIFLVLAALYSWWAWRRTTFAITATAVWFLSGILFRTQRHARLERIQAVDITHPILGRLFGLGTLKVEVAGGKDSNFTIGYLSTAKLEGVRAEILARAAGIKIELARDGVASSDREGGDITASPQKLAGIFGSAQEGSAITGSVPSVTVPVAPEREIAMTSPGRLIASILLSTQFLCSLLILVAWAVGSIVALILSGARALMPVLGTVLPLVLPIAAHQWHRFSGEFNFRLAVSPDGIRITRGLVDTRSQTIPPRRVHGVKISQPLLWRYFDWYRVEVSQAGYGVSTGSEGKGTGSSNVLLPVGTREEARCALWLVIRDLGVDDPQEFLETALVGSHDEGGFIHTPRRARILHPWLWARRGVILTATAAVLRTGRLSRSVSMVAFERLQSAQLSQGPLQRHYGLVSVTMDLVQGPVKMIVPSIPRDEGVPLLEELLEKSRRRRVEEPPEKWMRRVERSNDQRVAQPGQESDAKNLSESEIHQ